MIDTNSRIGRELPLYKKASCLSCEGRLTFLNIRPFDFRERWHCNNCGINYIIKRAKIDYITTIEKLPKIIQPSKGES